MPSDSLIEKALYECRARRRFLRSQLEKLTPTLDDEEDRLYYVGRITRMTDIEEHCLLRLGHDPMARPDIAEEEVAEEAPPQLVPGFEVVDLAS